MMAISILVAAAILVTISYLALKILSGVVVTPPTPLRELSGEPREAWRLPGEKVMQLQVAPEGDRAALLSRNEADGETSLRVYSLGENPQLLLTRPVQGYRLEWLYGSPSALVYEDAGGSGGWTVSTGSRWSWPRETPISIRIPCPHPTVH